MNFPFSLSSRFSTATSGVQGFSTVLALLLTGFLVTLAAGVLFLFLSENKINQSLFNGTSSFHAAEGAMEYALLKLKHHREWFQDTLEASSFDGETLRTGAWREAKMSYEIQAQTTTYTGTIAPNTFEILPLFVEKGEALHSNSDGSFWNAPNGPDTLSPPRAFYDKQETGEASLTILEGERMVWNIIGNDTSGDTFGISGILCKTFAGPPCIPGTDPWVASPVSPTLTSANRWNFRKYQNGILSQETKTVGDFLSTYVENYLVLYNPTNQAVRYTLASPPDRPFALPNVRVVASGLVGNSRISLSLSENKSKLFEVLKYSLFVPE
jgi:hypothetical protein